MRVLLCETTADGISQRRTVRGNLSELTGLLEVVHHEIPECSLDLHDVFGERIHRLEHRVWVEQPPIINVVKKLGEAKQVA